MTSLLCYLRSAPRDGTAYEGKRLLFTWQAVICQLDFEYCVNRAIRILPYILPSSSRHYSVSIPDPVTNSTWPSLGFPAHYEIKIAQCPLQVWLVPGIVQSHPLVRERIPSYPLGNIDNS